MARGTTLVDRTKRPTLHQQPDVRSLPGIRTGKGKHPAISSPLNAGAASQTTNPWIGVFPWAAREGTSSGFCRVGVSVRAPHFPVGFRQPTFLRHCLLGWIFGW